MEICKFLGYLTVPRVLLLVLLLLFHMPYYFLFTKQNAAITAETSLVAISLLHSYSWPLSSADKCHGDEIILYFRASHCAVAGVCTSDP